MQRDFEYGSGGLIGIAPPQANPTVEPEMQALMPSDVATLTTRLRGDKQDVRKRFSDYLLNLADSLDSYGGITLDACGFACTATTYLLGEATVNREFGALSQRFGYPIISSASAIRLALDELGARKIALFGPYPGWLQQASADFWAASGFELVAKCGADLAGGNTLGIYTLRSDGIVQIIRSMAWQEADAIVLTGTGAPTLNAIPSIAQFSQKPVLSSNLCLAWALLRTIGHHSALPVLEQGSVLVDTGWASRRSDALMLAKDL